MNPFNGFCRAQTLLHISEGMFFGISIIILTLFAIYLKFRLSGQSVRDAILTSWIFTAVFVFGVTETLSLFQIFKPVPLTCLWILLLLGFTVLLLPLRRQIATLLLGDTAAFCANIKCLYGSCRFSLLAVCVILALTLIHALFSPSFDFDSLSYHLPRATHWLVNGSIRFYETAIARQNFQAPLYSFILAHVMALTHSDIFLNLIQWTSFTVSAIAVSLIAKELKVCQRGQWLVAVLVFSIPQAISQTIVCVNDLFAATAVMAFVLYLIRFLRNDRFDWLCALQVSCAMGVAFLSKYTSLIHVAGFAVPLAVMALIRILRKGAFRRTAIIACTLAIIAAAGTLFLAPQIVRNMRCYGDPLSGEPPGLMTNVNLTPEKLVVNYARHVSMHIAFPFYTLNRPVERVVRKLSGALINDPDITYQNSLCSTDYRIITPLGKYSSNASNPVQFVLYCVLLMAILLSRFKGAGSVSEYSVVPVLLGTLLYAIVFKWQPWCVRLQIPYFMLMMLGIVLWLETHKNTIVLGKVAAFISLGYALLHIVLLSDWYMPAFLYGQLPESSGLNVRASLAQKIAYLQGKGWPADVIAQMRLSVPAELSEGYSIFMTDRNRLYMGNFYREDTYNRYDDRVNAVEFLRQTTTNKNVSSNIGLIISSDHGNMQPERMSFENRPFAWEFVLWTMADNLTGEKPLKFEHFAGGDPQHLAKSYFGDKEGLVLSDYSRESVLNKLKEARTVDRVFSNRTFSVYSVGLNRF